MPDDIETLLRRLIGRDDGAAEDVVARAEIDSTPTLLVAAALLTDDHSLLTRAATNAVTTRDRQLVAVAAAHLAHDEDLFQALVRDHLADHPDNILAAWIATKHTRPTRSTRFNS